jgi:nudix-type nucleoside diphosphatase (YffH/AdpP family)
MGGAALAVSMSGELRALIRGDGSEAEARLAFWQAATGGLEAPDAALERALADDILALRGQVPAERLRARRNAMLLRAAARLRAEASPVPQGLRRGAHPGDATRGPVDLAFAGFFAIETFLQRFRRFDGSFGPAVPREVFVSADAVTVLPWDPRRDRVLLVEQMRTAPMVRGEANPWQLEAVAGRIDAGETPEEAARREALEEAGLALGPLEKVAEYYSSPGAVTEYIYSYVAPCDLPDDVAGTFGLAEEAEDIRGHLLSVDDLEARMAAGELNNAPLILTVQWLLRHRARLRAAWGG